MFGAIKTPLPPKIVEISLVKMTKNFKKNLFWKINFLFCPFSL